MVCAGIQAEGNFAMDTNELFSELSISLFGQPVTAQDILMAEIQPHIGARTLHTFVLVAGQIQACTDERASVLDRPWQQRMQGLLNQ